MLAALERGLKGGKWFSLIDKVYSPSNLKASLARVIRNRGGAGVDGQTIAMFRGDAENKLRRLQQELVEGRYKPLPVKRSWIPKPGSREKRPLGVPAIRDRIVQTALRNVCEPIFEKKFAEQSYGFRPGRGCKDALRRVDRLLKEGYTWVVDADLKSYFDSIPHDKLMEEVKKEIADGRVLGLIEQYLKASILDGLKEWTPEKGTPQGAVISPLLSNIYLNPLDHLMAESGFEMVRYADDFVLLCRSREEAERGLELVREWAEAHGLTLHPEKTRLVDARKAREGFDFLGYHFERGLHWPRKKSMKKLRETIRAKTKRTSGRSMECIIEDINRTLRGWFGYFKHSHKYTFRMVDGWVRMRLRSILRKRRKGKGRGRGADHQRWPNAYFTELGFFSLEVAHAKACQSR